MKESALRRRWAPALRPLLLLLTVAGACRPPERAEYLTQHFTTTASVTPSQRLREQLRSGRIDFTTIEDKCQACTMYAHAVRSTPGYSVRTLSSEITDFILSNGVAEVICDVTVRIPRTFAASGNQGVSGSFVVHSIRNSYPTPQSSWVAEAAWLAIPRSGDFTLGMPAGTMIGAPGKQLSGSHGIGQAVTKELETLLAKDIEPELRRLLKMDSLTRYETRKAFYGVGECMMEACPHEDGIDSLMVLGAAQQLCDSKFLTPLLKQAAEQDQEEVLSLSRRICGVMRPKQWKSVMRERLEARPIFISKSAVVLQLAAGGKRITVNRNAFNDESELILRRIEALMVDFVAKLNALTLDSLDMKPEDVLEAWRERTLPREQ